MDWQLARAHAENGEMGKAWAVVDEAMNANINDPKALVLASFLLEKGGKSTLAYHLTKRLVELFPNESAGWTNMGKCADDLWRMEEAERSYLKALKLCKEDKHRVTVLVNLSALYLQSGEWAKATKYAEDALKIEPDNRKGRHNLGICQLANKQWSSAWANYSHSVGSAHRIRWSYNDEPEWAGEIGKTVVVYGEQGIGDEINSASMFPDALLRAGRVIIDCDPRLTNLYKRSFPGATVYGTRAVKANLPWLEADQKPDYSISSMQLGGIFRTRSEDFPGTAYLKADPDRTLMWRALFQTKQKPVIGVSWTGGVKTTGAKFRQWDLTDLLPIFRSVDAHWVCLQYKDASKEIAAFNKKHPDIDLVQYAHATLTNDYDDTAAIVSACDRVIAMQTAICHLAGALGKDCWVFVPKNSQWRYAGDEDFTPWYRSVRVFRQRVKGEWAGIIGKAAEELRKVERKAA